MLNQIRSKYILKFIFSKLKEGKKLSLIKINKKIREIIDLNLLHYKTFSGKYFIGKKNGKGKEYNILNDQLIFEGDYIDGKRTGYGKEYIYDKFDDKFLIYEGKYLDGKRNGEGIEYYSSGKPSFKGIYVFGNKYSGIGYDKYGGIIYELKEGKGKIALLDFYNDDNYHEVFKGEYEYPNKIKGWEYCTHKKGNVNYHQILFSGEYKNNLKWNGFGYDDTKEIYEIKDGKGFIKELDYDFCLKFQGEYLNGKRNGKGTEYNYKAIFEGEYLDGKRNGSGKEYFIQSSNIKSQNGNYYKETRKVLVFEGEYLYNFRIKGKEYYLDGKLEFEGEYFLNKKFNGKGYDKDGNIIYELKNGNGKVKEYLNGDLIFEGDYLNGKIWNGKGKEYNSYGNKVFEGEYLNGKKWNGYTEIIETITGFKTLLVIKIRYTEGKKDVKRVYDHWSD